MISLTEVLLLIASGLVGLYFWAKFHYSYWKRKNVPYVEPNYLFGNIKEMLTMSSSAAETIQNLYNHENGKDQPILGIHIFNKPAVLVRDTELIKSILVKNFNKFPNRFATTDDSKDPLGTKNLFFVKNPHWKELRTKLTPVFTSGKLKQMFPLIEEVGNELDQYLGAIEADPKTKSFIQEVKEICALYTTDVIATCAFGINANSLKNPEADFRRFGRSIFNFTLWRAIEFTTVFFLPQWVKVLGCRMFPKQAEDFIRSSMNFIMDERIKNGNTRNDLIDFLISFKKQAELQDDSSNLKMDNDYLVAQAGIFFTAGYETSSATMAFGLYELSKRPELQDRLRNEIKEVLVKHKGQLTYEVVTEMEYLSMVIQEVLRMYPPLPFLDRQCLLPTEEKSFSLKPESDFAVPNGMPVYIPIYAIQRDTKYFDNPDEFDPERFSAENKANLKAGTYMPFGYGPHNCIGERFGLLQTKIGLISFLRNHYVTTCDKSHKVMKLDPMAMIIQAKGGVFCKVVRDPLV